MKSNNEDKVLMEKLGSLDTLSGGIVYGKEEAWEKLQGRLDAKPAKRIVLKYGMAAALLVWIGVTGIYFYSRKENRETQITLSTPIHPPVMPMAAIPQPETTTVHTSVTSNYKRKQKQNVERNVGPVMWHTSPVADPQLAVENNITQPPIAVTHPSPVKPGMKVVHVNDLNREDEQQNIQQDIAVNTAAVDISKLPKVHINDVIHEEYEVEKLLRENRLGTRNQFLLWRDRSDVYENETKNNTAEHQPLNRQRFRVN